MKNKLKQWWAEVLFDWALQVAPKHTKNGFRIRELVTAYHDLKN